MIDCSYRNSCGIGFEDPDLEYSLEPLKKENNHLFICSSLHFRCSGFPDLALGILKMLKLLFVRDVLQPAI